MSKEKLLLLGAGSFGRTVSDFARLQYDCAFLDDNYAPGDSVCGLPVVGKIEDIDKLFGKYRLLTVTVGSSSLREKYLQRARNVGYEIPTILSPTAYVSPFASVGEGCVLLQNVCVQNGAFVGKGVLLNPGVEVHADAIVADYALVYTNSVVRTGALVGRRARVGSNVTVCNFARVPEDTDVPDCMTVRMSK